MAKKISELTAATTMQNGDLLEVSRDNGAGAFDSRKITFANFKAAVPSNPRTIDMVTGSNVTGTLTKTLSASILIPANTLTAVSVIETTWRAIRVSGTNSTITVDAYVNTANSLSGATLLATINSMTSSNYISQGIRSIFCNISTNQWTVLNNGATVGSDYVNTGANSVLSVNETVDNYLIYAIQLANVGDTGLVQFAHATIYE
jgi:hypothetical protein